MRFLCCDIGGEVGEWQVQNFRVYEVCYSSEHGVVIWDMVIEKALSSHLLLALTSWARSIAKALH